MKHTLINSDCLDVLQDTFHVDTIMADPPDNIGLGYGQYQDRQTDSDYIAYSASGSIASSSKPTPSGSRTTPSGLSTSAGL